MENERILHHENVRVSRRQFLKITAIAGSLAGAGALGLDALHTDPRVSRVQTTRLLLGTVANITLISDHSSAADAALDASFARMQALEQVMSRFNPDSQLAQINAAGDLTGPHPALVEVLERAVYYGDMTGGAFDVTVEPVLALYRTHANAGRLPIPEDVDRKRALVNYLDLDVRSERIRLGRPGMAITLDGIAKGYIIDQGADELRRRGFEHVLVELGGDMQAAGRAGERPWQVELQSPRAQQVGQTQHIAALQDCALATSGDYMQAFTPDFRLHHILNPSTGDSPPEVSSASVIAPTACDADALATASMVLGTRKALDLMNTLPGVEGVVVDKAGHWYPTANFTWA